MQSPSRRQPEDRRAIPTRPIPSRNSRPAAPPPKIGDDFYALRRQRSRERENRERDEASRAAQTRVGLAREDDFEAPLSPHEDERFERLVGNEPGDKLQKCKTKCAPCHFGLLAFALLLTAFSIPMIYSASTAIALDVHNTTDFFLKRQLVFVGFGLLAMLGASRLRGEWLRGGLWVLYGVCFLGLLAVKFSPLGLTQGNAERWLHLGPIQIQVSEFAKIALIGVMADFWSRASKSVQKAAWPWLACVLWGLPILGLVVIQPHFSAFALMVVLVLAIALYAGAPLKHFGVILSVLAVLSVVGVVLCKAHAMPGLKPYQEERIAAHFGGDSKDDARGSDYQSLQGQRAILRGGWFGMGPGASLYKQGHLPAPHTDFILAVIGEEFGFAGMFLLLGCYAGLIFFCFQTGFHAHNTFEALLCAGIGTLIAVQTLGNAGVVSGLLPVTGMPLPLLTYGGSGLIATLMGIGLVLAVSRRAGEEETA